MNVLQFCCRHREMTGQRRVPVVRLAITHQRYRHHRWAMRPWGEH